MLRRHHFASVLALLAATSFSIVGCSSTPAEDESSDDALANTDVKSSGWELDIAKMNAAFPEANAPIREGHPEDAYTVVINAGGKKIPANTHMFTKTVNVIPYADPNDPAEAVSPSGKGDAVIGQYIQPGEVGFMIKHHRPANRYLDMSSEGGDMKENFKLQDTHIGIVVGVDRGGKAGAITINNPKNYQQGAFGDDHYPMVFVKPVFPTSVSADQAKLYMDNIRTMAVLFNTVSVFPGDYNGGDPLAARNPDQIKIHVAQMVKAIGGDADAKKWFEDPANKIYCAELAHVSSSAGILVPLAKQYVIGLKDAKGVALTDSDWSNFTAKVGSMWPFSGDITGVSNDSNTANPRLADLAKYKPDFNKLSALKPIDQVATAPKRDDGLPSRGLAFEPMTMADIVQHFLRTHIPRDPDRQVEIESLRGAGETVAPIQAQMLTKMEPGLYQSMQLGPGNPALTRTLTDAQLDELPTNPALKPTVKDVFDGIVRVVAKQQPSYAEFQKAVQPYLAIARKMTGPRGDVGEGLFVPPSLLHVITQGAHPGGYLTLKYLGHGVHFSLVKKAAGGGSTQAPAQNTGGATPAPSGNNNKTPAPQQNNGG